MNQPRKARRRGRGILNRKNEQGPALHKPLNLDLKVGRIFSTDKPRVVRPAEAVKHFSSTAANTSHTTSINATTSISTSNTSSSTSVSASGGSCPVPPSELQMAPLTVPLLPHVAPRPILTQRTPPQLRSNRAGRVYGAGQHHSRGNLGRGSASVYTHGAAAATQAAQIQLLRPNNTPVTVEKINLDRRGLTSWPNLTQEEPVRLLSLQHNLLTSVDPPTACPALVLLDLYHNHVSNLRSVHAFPNLRVLMLAKNRLSKLEGLETLTKLEVLDLHGNQLYYLQGLSHLKDLRLLNLAGNMLRHVTGLRGLDSLVELNLRRNLIRTVADLHYLPRLEKVFLAHNEIYRYEDISCLQNCLKLRELSLEQNPLSASHPNYFHTAVARFYRLRRLDDRDVTLDTRRQSEKALRKAREKERAAESRLNDQEQRNSAITNAIKHWETLKKQRRRFTRKNSESSAGTCDHPASKASEATEYSSGICGDYLSEGSEGGQEGKKEEAEAKKAENEVKEDRVTGAKVEGEQNQVPRSPSSDQEKRALSSRGEREVTCPQVKPTSRKTSVHSIEFPKETLRARDVDDDNASLISSSTSSGVSDAASSGRSVDLRLPSTVDRGSDTEDSPEDLPAEKESEEFVQDRTISRSRSCNDMMTRRGLPNSTSNRPSSSIRPGGLARPGSGVRAGSARRVKVTVQRQDSSSSSLSRSEKIGLEMTPSPPQNVPTVRRNSAKAASRNVIADKLKSRLPSGESGRLPNKVSKVESSLKKTDSVRSFTSLPDKTVTATMKRVKSNLSLPSQSLHPPAPSSPSPSPTSSSSSTSSSAAAGASETSECESSSCESDTQATLTNPGGSVELSLRRVLAAKSRVHEASSTTRPSDRGGGGGGCGGGNNHLADRHLPRDPIGGGGPSGPSGTTGTSNGILREQGPNFLAELEGDVLSLYGQGALRCTDIGWDKSTASNTVTARFQYMSFDDIVDIFPKLRVKFPRLENFSFVETNLVKCGQLNALAELHQISSLEVSREGNPLLQVAHWRLYAIFRLAHWGLRTINGREVTEDEKLQAAVVFAPLGQLAFTCLPRDQLAAFLCTQQQAQQQQQQAQQPGESQEQPGVLGPSGGCSGSAGQEGQDARRLNDPHLQDLIGKEALQYRPAASLSQEESAALGAAGRQARHLLVWTYDSLRRLNLLNSTWPSVLHDLVRDAITDLVKPNYGKVMLEDVKRDMGWRK